MNYINEYINDAYILTMSGQQSFCILDKFMKKEIGTTDMTNHIMTCFRLSSDEIDRIKSNWVNEEISNIENRIVYYQDDIYNKTGIKIQVTHELLLALDLDIIDIIGYLNKEGDISELGEYVRKVNRMRYDDY